MTRKAGTDPEPGDAHITVRQLTMAYDSLSYRRISTSPSAGARCSSSWVAAAAEDPRS